MVRDVHEGVGVARQYSRLFLAVALSAIVSPLLGTILLAQTGWQGSLVLLLLLSCLLLLAVMIALPETLPPARRVKPGFATILRNFHTLAVTPPFVLYTISLGCSTGALVAMTAGAPFVLQDAYDLPSYVFGILFSVGSVGTTAVTVMNGRLLNNRSEGNLLLLGSVANLFAVVVLLALADQSPLFFMVSFVTIFAAWGLVGPNAAALAVRHHASIAGAAVALLGLAQFGTAAAAAPLSGIGGATATSLGIAVACLVVVGAATAFLGVKQDDPALPDARSALPPQVLPKRGDG
jgi:DHA1 family bicyclomycin/chloramphenicol resistance-like MFS transporter